MTHRRGPHLLLALIAALAAWPDPVAPGQGAARPEFRVYYAFDPAVPDQLDRAVAARRLTAALPLTEWVGVVPAGRGAVLDPGTVAVDDLLDPQADTDLEVATWLRQPVAADRILVLNRTTGATFAGPGGAAAQITAAAGLGAGAATDVGITTWGKVKDLFR